MLYYVGIVVDYVVLYWYYYLVVVCFEVLVVVGMVGELVE